MEFRFLDTGKNTPYMNMAIDEALLASNSPVLRFYQWLPPAISIGFSQSMSREINIAECHKQGIGYVRRLTGGKAVFHESELTYSIILSAESVPESIVESYEMNGHPDNAIHSSICFNEPSYYEIVVDSRKLVGSAQVRKGNKVLQHGSVLIDANIEKLCSLFNIDDTNIVAKTKSRMTSLNRVLGRNVAYQEVVDAMCYGFGRNFKCRLVPDLLTQEEIESAKRLSAEKYSTDKWNFLR